MKLSSVALTLIAAKVASANNWETYPEVPKTASINGFADPIYDDLPECARECVELSTGNTPCPYWDTGCLCVMPQWSGAVAQCIAESCREDDVVSATSMAYSLCSEVGADLWLMPASITAALTSAAGEAHESAPEPTATEFAYLLDDEEEDEEESSTSAEANGEETSSASAMGVKLTGGLTLALGSFLALLA